jgi:hypothetical protein
MPLLDVILGCEPAFDRAEEDLGKPDELEATSLSHHINRCALRWSMSYRASRSNSAQLRQLRFFMVILAILLVLTSNPATKILEKIFG